MKKYFIAYDFNDDIIWGIGKSPVKAFKDGVRNWDHHFDVKKCLCIVECSKEFYKEIKREGWQQQVWSINNNIAQMDKDITEALPETPDGDLKLVYTYTPTYLMERFTEMRSLIDGAYEIVMLHNATTPYKKKWKKEWLDNAKKHGAGLDC